MLVADVNRFTEHPTERVARLLDGCDGGGEEEHVRQHECLLHLLDFVLCHACVYSFMSVSVEGVSALVAEFVGVAVLDVFLAAVGALVYLVHAGEIDELRVSTIGAVVSGEELVESLDGLVNAGEVVHVLELTKPVNLAEDADREVTLVFFIRHVSGVCG